MKLGIISDIHGNVQALQAVLGALDAEGVDLILCAGDLVCYGAQPNEVIETLIAWGIPAVMGNYDAAVAWDLPKASRKPSSPQTEPLKQAALDWAKAAVRPQFKRYLRGLPFAADFQLGRRTLKMIHAGLDHLDDWYTPDEPEEMAYLAARLREDAVILGHTHRAFAYTPPKGTTDRGPLFINPGAVGRSLDGDPRASFAIFDTVQGQVTFHRADYALDEAVHQIRASGMPAEIALLIQHAARRVEQVAGSR
jgi:putative phosphoesterase